MNSLVESVELVRDLLDAAGIDHPNIKSAITSLDALRRDVGRLERQLAEARGEIGVDELAPRVHEIGAYWRDNCGHPRAKIDGKRYRAVRARLVHRGDDELDERVAYIKRAIDGAAAAPNRNEQTGEAYDDLELICRDETKLDSFAKRAPSVDVGELERKLIGE